MPRRVSLALACLALWLQAGTAWAQTAAPEGAPVPRTIIALVETEPGFRLRDTRLHQLATMPLEHLGLVVEYHRVDRPLPDLSDRPDVRGVLSWLSSPSRPDALALLEWYERALGQGKKLVFLGSPGVSADPKTGEISVNRINRMLGRIGLRRDGRYVGYTHGAELTVRNPQMWGFEYTPPLPPPFESHTVIDPAATAHLSVEVGGPNPTTSDLVVTGPNGGIVAPSYAMDVDPDANIRRWIIDPFEFFRLAFATDDLPKPDTTTLVGRRLYYSHVDGDGWRSVSEIEIDDEPASAARVLLERVTRRFPDLPVTIAPIAAELDRGWIDDEEAREVAQEFFELPHVEAGSHTYSHPFKWSYYEAYDPAHEREIVSQAGVDHDIHDGYANIVDTAEGPETGTGDQPEGELGVYTIPRAFFSEPYDLEKEVGGSVRKIAEIGGKPVRIYQWSGDTTPYEAAVAAAREAGIPNINGGDTRFDSDHRSYGFVAPISVPVGAERQIYASISNENTFTDLWTGRFFGFRHMLQTVDRTGLPIRVKPINVYYHSYSAEKVASANALIQVHQAMAEREIAPVTTSNFAEIAGGFYTTRFVPLGERRWRVEDRGALQTLRFDQASLTAVDFSRSVGVLGARPAQGSLYVALDPEVAAPIVALTTRDHPIDPDPADRPYLLQSRWPARGLQLTDAGVAVSATGFGTLEMTWVVPEDGTWRVRVDQDGRTVWRDEIAADPGGRISFAADDGVEPTVDALIRIERAAD
ncbi:MAG: hypothetical protein RLO01_10850 [Thalassobaculaceae bacterium]